MTSYKSALVAVSLIGGTAFGDMIALPETPLPEPGNEITIDQFDPSQGMLESVELRFDEVVLEATAMYENTDVNQSALFTVKVEWLMQLLRGDTQEMLLELGVMRQQSGLVDPFDGVEDYAGFSGVTFPMRVVNQSASILLNDAAALDYFTGPDTVALDYAADAQSSAESGSASHVNDYANVGYAGKLNVVYNYVIPEPLTVGLLAVGALFLRRR